VHQPPLHTLRAFAEAARLGSFTRAAEVLNVTQSAVSQQIRQLEQLVGAPLFERTGRHISLTEVGGIYLQLVSGPMSALEESHATISAMIGRSAIILRVPRAFGSHWLAPRLPDLYRRHPEISLTMLFLDHREDIGSHQSDFVISTGSGITAQSDLVIEPLLTSVVTPVASPSVASGVNVAHLATAPIIHTLRRYDDWRSWCERAGVPTVPRDQGWTFESSTMSYSAAVHGLGVVMAELHQIRDEMADGRLVRLSPIDAHPGRTYSLIAHRAKMVRPSMRKFRDWIIEQSRELMAEIA